MADNDEFVIAQGPNGDKRRVPRHYLDNPAFGFKLPPSARVRTDEEGEAVTPIGGAEAPTDTTEDATAVVEADPKKEARREGSR